MIYLLYFFYFLFLIDIFVIALNKPRTKKKGEYILKSKVHIKRQNRLMSSLISSVTGPK